MSSIARKTISFTLAATLAAAALATVMPFQTAMARGSGGSETERNPALNFMLAEHEGDYRPMMRDSYLCHRDGFYTHRCYERR